MQQMSQEFFTSLFSQILLKFKRETNKRVVTKLCQLSPMLHQKIDFKLTADGFEQTQDFMRELLKFISKNLMQEKSRVTQLNPKLSDKK